jgi:hypothetical protein
MAGFIIIGIFTSCHFGKVRRNHSKPV